MVGFTVGDIFSTLGSMLTGSGRRGRRAAGIEEGGPPEEESILGETPGTEQIPETPAGPAQRGTVTVSPRQANGDCDVTLIGAD